MARGNIKNLKFIKKGEVLNPLGAGAHNKAIKSLKRLSQKEVAAIAEALLSEDKKLLKKITRSQHGFSNLQRMLAGIMLSAINHQNEKKAEMILNRCVGKVPDKVELSGRDGGPMQTANLSPSERKALIKENDAKLKLTDDE